MPHRAHWAEEVLARVVGVIRVAFEIAFVRVLAVVLRILVVAYLNTCRGFRARDWAGTGCRYHAWCCRWLHISALLHRDHLEAGLCVPLPVLDGRRQAADPDLPDRPDRIGRLRTVFAERVRLAGIVRQFHQPGGRLAWRLVIDQPGPPATTSHASRLHVHRSKLLLPPRVHAVHAVGDLGPARQPADAHLRGAHRPANAQLEAAHLWLSAVASG